MSPGSRRPPESPLLKRLRNATRTTGLIADSPEVEAEGRAIVVTNRLAQTTVRYLTHRVDAAVGQMLTEELRELDSPEAHRILMEDRGFTFFHVVQFLYEYARVHTARPDGEPFCLGMGRGGGGIEVEPNTEVISLVRLLVNALPPGDDHVRLGMLMRELGPMILGQIFPQNLFSIAFEPAEQDQLRIRFAYTDRAEVERLHAPLELADDVGAFFLNETFHIQGTLELGWRIFATDTDRLLSTASPIETLPPEEIGRISETCSCEWTVTWDSGIRLNRLTNDAAVLAQARTVYEAFSRKDVEYYLERIKSLEHQVRQLESGGRGDLIGTSDAMHRVYEMIDRVAESDLTVLIRGESGTGKELVARVIHDSSPRREKPFVAVNCAAFTETLLESELFGHEKGAFTGADKQKPGRFEMADGGTLLLDEVGDLPLTTQVKLLRALETQAFERVGGTQTIQTDVRIIGATNRDLEDLIEQGDFREDFYFRLHVLPLEVPPLRDHPEDVPLLAQHFLEKAAERAGKDVRGFSRGAISLLTGYLWPGNVRELQHVVERAVVVYSHGSSLSEDDMRLSLGIREAAQKDPALNLRQREVLSAVLAGGTTVDDVVERVAKVGRSDGRSKRTVQNDLRHLVELEYLSFYKEGSVRHYELTEVGKAAAAG